MRPQTSRLTRVTDQPAERRRRLRPDGTKPIDLTYLGRFTLGNDDLLVEVLSLFETHAPAYLAALISATSEKTWHDAAHTLKGSARGVGAWRVARCAELAERLGFAADPDRRAYALDSAADALDEAIGFARTLTAPRLDEGRAGFGTATERVGRAPVSPNR